MTALLILAALVGCGGSDPPADPPATTSSAAAARPGPVVFIGDSITALWGGPIAEAVPPADPSLEELVPGAIDAGVAGQTSAQMLERFGADVLTHRPSVVVILAGTNDICDAGDSASTADVATMADEAAAAGAKVIIGTVPPVVSSSSCPLRTMEAAQRFNAEVVDLVGAHGYGLADYFGAMVNADGSQNASLFDSDGIHPNAAGFSVMWGVLEPILRENGG